MKAHEVLKRYETGRRDFSGENLRGQSFKGKNLPGANFSEADIRGANFTNATLRNANFRGAKAGLERRWAIILVMISWLVLGLSEISSAYVGYAVASIFDYLNENVIHRWVVLIVFVVFLIVTICKGLVAILGSFAVVVATTVVTYPTMTKRKP